MMDTQCSSKVKNIVLQKIPKQAAEVVQKKILSELEPLIPPLVRKQLQVSHKKVDDREDLIDLEFKIKTDGLTGLKMQAQFYGEEHVPRDEALPLPDDFYSKKKVKELG